MKALEHAVLAAAALLSVSGAAVAGDKPEADPAAYFQAFRETCRLGFPDLDAVAESAVAAGWQESQMRPVSGAADLFSAALPRAFHKNGMMLFLFTPTSGDNQQVCQVSGSANTRLTGAEVGAVVARGMTGQPVAEKKGDDEGMVWTVAPGMTVHAGVLVYKKKVRTISISARQQR